LFNDRLFEELPKVGEKIAQTNASGFPHKFRFKGHLPKAINSAINIMIAAAKLNILHFGSCS
jgi:hypothetical protein